MSGEQSYSRAEEGKEKEIVQLCLWISSQVGFHSLCMKMCGCVIVYTYLISPLIFFKGLDL